jgi:hypothetical protein
MWLETSLVPTLIIGQVIVMDKATFHKGGRIEELIQKAGCRLLYSNPRIICEFLTPEPRVRGGLGWGKKFTTPARIAIFITILP